MRSQPRTPADRHDERGIALVIALFLMAALSALAVSLTFLSQTETYSTMNYGLMSQARYAGESGVQKTVNYLLNTYTPPVSADVGTVFDGTKSPVTCLTGCTTTTGGCTISAAGVPTGQCVVLSAMSGVSSNYPVAATATAFAATGTGATATLVSGSTTISYSAYAVLMSIQAVGSSVVQTWAITSDGAVGGARSATVEVTSTLETPVIGVAGNSYAVFASSSACGAITFSGSATTNSYDSKSALVSGTPVILPLTPLNYANVGTNGNLRESGGIINGKLYTPRQGVGNCSNGGGGVAGDALSQSGGATVTGGLVQLPSTWAPPTPAAPSMPPPTTTQSFSGTTGCSGAPSASGSCTYPSGITHPEILHFSGGTTVATATLLGNVSVSNVAFHLGSATAGACNPACYYTVNSLSLSGSASIVIDGGPVIINVVASGVTGGNNALNLSGGGIANSSFSASNLVINYAGTQPINLSGGTSTSALVDAPNSPVTLSGGANFYGSILASTLNDSGGTIIHYDRELASMFSTQSAGNPLLTAFTWKKY
jgi:PilX N-terminal